MDGRDFFSRVGEHADLEWLGCREGRSPTEDVVLIRYRRTSSNYALAVEAIRDHGWEELQGVLTGARSPRVMTHVTRIVGYYSQLQNWNRSKIAELHDRHRGDYGVPETGRTTPLPNRLPSVPNPVHAVA
jgi:hypothetical protein